MNEESDSEFGTIEILGEGYEEIGRRGDMRFGHLCRCGCVWFVKSYSPEASGAESELRLRKEYQLLMRLNHPGVVRAGWLETLPDGSQGLVMEYVSGLPLDKFLRDASPSDRLEAASQLLDAMAYIHSRDVCHLDLKPEHILVSGSGSNLSVKIVDFGLSDSPGVAGFKTVGGNRRYGAPEQFDEGYRAAKTADVWALGTILDEIGGFAAKTAARRARRPSPDDRPADAAALLEIYRSAVARRKRSAKWLKALAAASTLTVVVVIGFYAVDRQPHEVTTPDSPRDTTAAVAESQPTIIGPASAENTPAASQKPSTAPAAEKPRENELERLIENGYDPEYAALIVKWRPQLDKRLDEMEKLLTDSVMPLDDRLAEARKRYDEMLDATKEYFQNYYFSLAPDERTRRPVSFCSWYEPAFEKQHKRLGNIKSRVR